MRRTILGAFLWATVGGPALHLVDHRDDHLHGEGGVVRPLHTGEHHHGDGVWHAHPATAARPIAWPTSAPSTLELTTCARPTFDLATFGLATFGLATFGLTAFELTTLARTRFAAPNDGHPFDPLHGEGTADHFGSIFVDVGPGPLVVAPAAPTDPRALLARTPPDIRLVRTHLSRGPPRPLRG